MQFEQPSYTQPFGYPQGTYHPYTSPQPGMPRPPQPYFDAAAAYGVPTPAPSPRTPSSTRRRTNTPAQVPQEFMGAEYVKRPSSSRRHASETYGEYEHRSSATSPRPGTSHSGRPTSYGMHTPLHTPPPTSHTHHGTPMPHGAPMPNIYAYGFPPGAGEYVSPFYPYQPLFVFQDGRQHERYPQQQATASSRRYRRPAVRRRNRADSYSRPQFAPSYTPAPGPQSPPPFVAEGRRSRSHHRRENTWSGENSPRSPHRTGSAKPTGPQRSATEPMPTTDHDELRRKAAEAGIPSDYSLKNWDPNERPIILLGSVFDANSLGEWVFNWTKYHHGRTHEATRTAGGLWELLIELSSKIKRARDFFDSIQNPSNKEILEEFMDSGERLWQKLKNLLKACEEYMWTGARRVSSPKQQDGKSTKVQMGKQSGAEFVDAMFNGEKEWEKTERLMRGMATWCQRFQVNCEEILMRPDA